MANTKSLLLDRNAWDLVLDAKGNIAVAADPYAVAQDVACAIRTFQGECWYNTTLGMPYFADILGQMPGMEFVGAKIDEQARTLPQVASVKVEWAGMEGRNLTGAVKVLDVWGAQSGAIF